MATKVAPATAAVIRHLAWIEAHVKMVFFRASDLCEEEWGLLEKSMASWSDPEVMGSSSVPIQLEPSICDEPGRFVENEAEWNRNKGWLAGDDKSHVDSKHDEVSRELYQDATDKAEAIRGLRRSRAATQYGTQFTIRHLSFSEQHDYSVFYRADDLTTAEWETLAETFSDYCLAEVRGNDVCAVKLEPSAAEDPSRFVQVEEEWQGIQGHLEDSISSPKLTSQQSMYMDACSKADVIRAMRRINTCRAYFVVDCGQGGRVEHMCDQLTADEVEAVKFVADQELHASDVILEQVVYEGSPNFQLARVLQCRREWAEIMQSVEDGDYDERETVWIDTLIGDIVKEVLEMRKHPNYQEWIESQREFEDEDDEDDEDEADGFIGDEDDTQWPFEPRGPLAYFLCSVDGLDSVAIYSSCELNELEIGVAAKILQAELPELGGEFAGVQKSYCNDKFIPRDSTVLIEPMRCLSETRFIESRVHQLCRAGGSFGKCFNRTVNILTAIKAARHEPGASSWSAEQLSSHMAEHDGYKLSTDPVPPAKHKGFTSNNGQRLQELFEQGLHHPVDPRADDKPPVNRVAEYLNGTNGNGHQPDLVGSEKEVIAALEAIGAPARTKDVLAKLVELHGTYARSTMQTALAVLKGRGRIAKDGDGRFHIVR